LSGRQGDHRIGGNFHVFDEIGIDDERDLVQARQADHKVSIGKECREEYCWVAPSGARGALTQML